MTRKRPTQEIMALMDDTILRQWTLLRSIPNHPRRIATTQLQAMLADIIGEVSLRTVQRDLNKLSLVFQIEGDQSKPQGWCWRKGHKLDVQTLEPATALTFNLAEAYLTRLLPPAATAQLQPWFNAARNISSTKASAITRWQDKIRVIPGSPFRVIRQTDSDVQRTVYEAVQTERMLEIDYRPISDDGEKTYPVHPLAIVVRDSTIYLVGRIRDYDDIRIIAVHRIASARIVDQPAILDPGFSIDSYLQQNSFQIMQGGGTVFLELRLDPQLARYLVEAPISDDQEITEAPDGSKSLKATVPDSVQLMTWLLSLGSAGIVLSPPDLRSRMKQHFAEITSGYEEIR
jgi:predicted DNA-binding transcriptional regulator YafY